MAFYRSNDIPQGYNKLAEISDNYLVWVRESKLNSGTSYNAYIQFLTPSFAYFFTDDYKIKTGSDYRYNAHYNSNNMYSYLDYYDCEYSLTTLEVASEDISTSDYDRADMPQIFVCQFLCCFFFVWILNQLSKLVKKGGVFGG